MEMQHIFVMFIIYLRSIKIVMYLIQKNVEYGKINLFNKNNILPKPIYKVSTISNRVRH